MTSTTTSGHSSATPSIMLQGTASSVGKSLLTAALCRIFYQDGVRVAPFKAQNMSNNSWVTLDGCEIARSQVVQAQAAGVEPDARMNPILLKPLDEKQSQVVVLGKAQGNWKFGHYASKFDYYSQIVHEAYDSLSEDYDLIILEGAGCSAEINLKKGDLVNMNMARHAKSNVYIVGDIDRGGVFASFIGMMATFEQWEKSLVQGFIVNRFRGDKALLGDIYDQMQEFTGRSITGVIPFIPDLFVPEEDGVQFASVSYDDQSDLEDRLDIAVIALRHVSNFTDLDSLRQEKSVRIRLVHSEQELGEPDIVILPGSRNVFSDFKFLQSKGLDSALVRLSERDKTEIVGICGGFQLMGQKISDPLGIESQGETIEPLGMLPVNTELKQKKQLTRERILHVPSNIHVTGYRIHHGLSVANNGAPEFKSPLGETLGCSAKNGLHWGTYLHGVFDSPEYRLFFLNRARKRKGLSALAEVEQFDLEGEFDRLASLVRSSIDMDKIYEKIGI